MALITDSRVWKIIIVIFFLLTAGFAAFFYFANIFVTIVVGLSLIILVNRMVEIFHSRIAKYRYPRWKVRLYGYALIVFWIIVALTLMIESFQDLGTVVTSVSAKNQTITGTYASHADEYLPQVVKDYLLTENTLKDMESYVISQLTALLSSLSGFLFNAILIIPLMFYVFFKRGDQIRKTAKDLVPDKFKKGYERAVKEIVFQMNQFLTAKIMESTIIACLCCLGFFIAGLKGWLLLGIIAGILNIVPYIGPIIGAIPPILVGLLDDPIVALFVLITVIIAQTIDNLYLIPFMISGKVQVDSLLSIFLILAGARLFGVMGMIFAIPIYLVYKIVLIEAYKELIKIYR